MADIIDVNIGDQVLEVYWQDEVELDLDMSLMYIKSGEKEIQNYVDNVSKPEIDNYIETQAKPIVAEVVTQIAEPTVNEYLETVTKPSIDEYVDGLKTDLQDYVDQAQASASASQASAEASAASALAAETALTTLTTTATDNFNANAAEKQAQVDASAEAAKTSETNAKASETNAKTSETNAEVWAEGTDAQVQALGGTKSAKGWAEASENLNYTDITNCITKIPQDIKLELSNGTLTLKAGSKVYDGDGNAINITSDIKRTDASAWSSISKALIICTSSSLDVVRDERAFSGDTAPASPRQYDTWYDTTNKIIKRYSDGSWTGNWSLPLGIFNGPNMSIDQVFNGFSHIGSTIFALPGVEGLIPNGRNTDGSLNNIKFVLDSVVLSERQVLKGDSRGFLLNYPSNKIMDKVYSIDNRIVGNRGEYVYNPELNNIYDSGGAGSRFVLFGYYTSNGTRITSFNPKPCFHAVDYYDFKQLDDNTVHKTGDENIAGIKTFIQGDIRGRTSTSTSSAVARYACFDKDGVQYSDVWVTRSEQGNSNGISWAGFRISDSSGSVTGNRRSLAIMKLANSDTIKTQAPTPPAGDNSTQIATTNWVKANSYAASGANYVKLADGTIIQWGRGTYNTTVSLPTPFSSTNYVAFIVDTSVTSNATTNYKTTSFDYNTNKGSNRNISWLAIGR